MATKKNGKKKEDTVKKEQKPRVLAVNKVLKEATVSGVPVEVLVWEAKAGPETRFFTDRKTAYDWVKSNKPKQRRFPKPISMVSRLYKRIEAFNETEISSIPDACMDDYSKMAQSMRTVLEKAGVIPSSESPA